VISGLSVPLASAAPRCPLWSMLKIRQSSSSRCEAPLEAVAVAV
jgi:hypothetical protein